MSVRIVTASQPIATPADVPGGHAADDALVSMILAAATNATAAPEGWLGRSLGKQTLEWSGSCWPDVLPAGPVIRIVRVDCRRSDNVDVTLDPTAYRLVGDVPVQIGTVDTNGDADAIRITYEAGYEAVPVNAKFAIVLMAADYLTSTDEKGGLRSFEVQGAFTEQYNSPDTAGKARAAAVKSLLAPLRVFA